MRNSNFLIEESGAITVDWVVLTAAILGLGLLVLMPVAFSTDSTVQRISAYIAQLQMGYSNN